MNNQIVRKSVFRGVLASGVLLLIYFAFVSLISGWGFAQDQFGRFWYFIVPLSLGFGIQFGIYSYLKAAIIQKNLSKSVLAVSGTTSTVAMISCCTHYLANFLPILGITGVVVFVSQYQVELFWLGLGFNLLGIFYMLNKLINFLKS